MPETAIAFSSAPMLAATRAEIQEQVVASWLSGIGVI